MENVLLLFGGMSYEHDISIVTASQIFNKTKSEKFKLIPVYISRENKFFVYLEKGFNLKDFSKNSVFKPSKKFKEVVFVSSEKNTLFQKTMFGLKEFLYVKNAIVACHGGSGENGELVAFLEGLNIKCSSGNVDSLGVCMNKFLFKQVMKGIGVPVVAGFKLNRNDFDSEEFKRKLFLRMRFLSFPLILKPNKGGSSIGLFVAKNNQDFNKKLEECFEFDDDVVIEKFVQNSREFNVAVVGTKEEFEVSEIDEPLKLNDVLSFKDKYLSGAKTKKTSASNSMASQARKFPAEISDELRNQIRAIASKIFKELNLSGIVRIDFLFDENNNKLFVCEVNSVPGSLAYYFFAENKITTNWLIKKLINISDKNFANKTKFNSDFVTNVLEGE